MNSSLKFYHQLENCPISEKEVTMKWYPWGGNHREVTMGRQLSDVAMVSDAHCGQNF